jgi:hypothetical protein
VTDLVRRATGGAATASGAFYGDCTRPTAPGHDTHEHCHARQKARGTFRNTRTAERCRHCPRHRFGCLRIVGGVWRGWRCESCEFFLLGSFRFAGFARRQAVDQANRPGSTALSRRIATSGSSPKSIARAERLYRLVLGACYNTPEGSEDGGCTELRSSAFSTLEPLSSRPSTGRCSARGRTAVGCVGLWSDCRMDRVHASERASREVRSIAATARATKMPYQSEGATQSHWASSRGEGIFQRPSCIPSADCQPLC